MASFLASCDLTERRAEEAGRRIGEARALEAATPVFPDACRVTLRAGVQPGDDFRAALGKYDAALSRQNRRITDCAAWYDQTFP